MRSTNRTHLHITQATVQHHPIPTNKVATVQHPFPSVTTTRSRAATVKSSPKSARNMRMPPPATRSPLVKSMKSSTRRLTGLISGSARTGVTV